MNVTNYLAIAVVLVALCWVAAESHGAQPGKTSADEGALTLAHNTNVTILNRDKLFVLDGRWHFKADPQDAGEAKGWYRDGIRDRTCRVPSTWQIAFEDLRDYTGTGWFEREFTVASKHRGRRIAAVFCGVNYYAKVWINGQLAGQHEGGYIPFDVDLTRFVRFDEPNTITVKVTDPKHQLENPVGYQQIEFERMSGIWRQVWIETTGPTYVSDIYVAPDIDASLARVQVEVNAPPQAQQQTLGLDMRVSAEQAGEFVAEKRVVFAASGKPSRVTIVAEIPIKNPQLWTPATPHLYTLTAKLTDGKTVVDSASRDFGMRKIDTHDVHIRLNNRPIFLRGAIDAGDVPDKNVNLPNYHAPTDEEIKRQVQTAKRLGFNVIRKHLIIDDHRYFDWADRLGLLVYGEPPYYWSITEKSRARWREQVAGWVRRDRSHPSVAFWALFNAASGLEPMPLVGGIGPKYVGDRPTHEEQARIVREARAMVKGLDPTRPVLDTSGGKPFDTEIVALMRYGYSGPHAYRKARAHHPALRADTAPGSPNQPEAVRRRRPLICGELGGYVFFPDMEKFKRQWNGQTPWPIVRPAGLGWGNFRAMGEGYAERFYEWGLDEAYGSFARFAEQHDWAAFRDLKFETEQLRKSPDVTGHLFTLYNSVGPFVHGLVDYDGSLRPFSQELAELQTPDLLILDWNKLNFWPGEEFRAGVSLSHYSQRDIDECVVKWTLAGIDEVDIAGELTGISMEHVGVKQIGNIAFVVPRVAESTRLRLVAELYRGDERISRNYTDLYVYPQSLKRPGKQRKLNVVTSPARKAGAYAIGDTTGLVRISSVPVAIGDRITFIADPINHGGNDTQTLHARITARDPKKVWDVSEQWTTDPAQNTETSTWSKRWIEKPPDVTVRDGKYTLMTRNSFCDSLWNIGEVPPRFWNVGTDRGPFTWKNESKGEVGIAGPTGVRVPPGAVVWNPVNIGAKRYLAIHSWLSPIDEQVDVEFQATLLQASGDGVRFFIEHNDSQRTLADVTPHVKAEAGEKTLPWISEGYEQHAGIDPSLPVAVATVFDDSIDKYLAEGGTVLLLVNDNKQLPPDLGLTVGGVGYALAAKDHFWGYINSSTRLFEDIPNENPLGWNFCNVLTSQKAIAGLDAAYKRDILVGAYSEWLRTAIRSPERTAHGSITSLVVQFRYKQGRIVMTTLDLLSHLRTDPVARIMFHDLVEYCHTDFQPTTTLPLGAR
jgi:hypothetical protein